MAGMAEVAKATVTIIPNMQGAQQTITSQLADASGVAGLSASNLAGSSFLSGFAGKLSGLSGLMSKLIPAASVGAVGKALFDIGSEFDDMTDTIIVGTGASGEALESLRKSAMDMATTVPMSFGDAGNIVQDLNTRLGLTGDTLTEVGTQIAQLGDITGEAFDTEAFSGAMSVWGTAAEDMSGQLDMLFAVSQSTGIGVNELTGIVESAGPSMQGLGYSFEETAAMAGLLDKAGLDANGTMSKMSKALTTLAKDGEQPANAMKRITTEIGEYIKKGDKAAAVKAAADLFGTKGAAQFVAAVESGSMSIDEFAEAMSDSGGIIAETEERTMDFGEHVQILKNQFKELLEPIGSAVFTGLSAAVARISTAFGSFVNGPGKTIGTVFRNIVSTGQEVIKVFAKAFSDTSGLKSFGSAMTTVKDVVKKVFSALEPVYDVLSKLLSAILPPLAKLLGGAFGSAFKGIASIAKTVGSAIEGTKKTIDSIKSAFESFKRVVTAPFRFLAGLKIPRVHVSGGSAPWGIGGLGQKPSFSVTWGARGGILDSATLIGAGEAGKEALLPLERDTSWADIIADKIKGNGGITNYFTINNADNPEAVAQAITTQLKLQMRSA